MVPRSFLFHSEVKYLIYAAICGFLKTPQNYSMGFNTTMVQFRMIWGTPILQETSVSP